MRIALGADHAGVTLKDHLKRWLIDRGDVVSDVGTDSTASVDYPDFAVEVARGVASGAFDRGILVCGTGLGMAIAANKIAGVRAAPVTDEAAARLAREHNDANVLALGARRTGPAEAEGIVRVFLDTPFGAGRHQPRVDKIRALDESRTERP